MNRRDIEAELSAPGARALLTSTSSAHLAYIGMDETPRVIPVGFFWTGDQAVVATATTSPKVVALSGRPDVALAIDAGDTPDQARALSIRGRADVENVDGVVPEYLAAAKQTMDPQAAEEFERNVRGRTVRWRKSRSRRTGCATTTSTLAVCRGSCRTSSSKTSPDDRIATLHGVTP